ncbi:MAG: arginine--tRNA ligase [bacterium]|nr:arginine--tRNA ligase [bacterium]
MEERIQKALGKGAIIRRPPHLDFGDYAVFVGPERAESAAQAIRDELRELAAKVEVAGKGFVNITLARGAVTFLLAEADAKGEAWGKGTSESGKRIMVEYSNPNAFKEMHVGHLVGTVIGEAVARLVENSGATVARDTFGGDIGPNVAKALWGLRKKGITEPTTAGEIGEAYVNGSNAYENDQKAKPPFAQGSGGAREEIDALNQAIYAGTDRALMALWRKGRDVSMDEFRRIWRLLGTHFDFEFFDSDTTETGLRVVQDGLTKGIFEKSDGAIIYNGEKRGVHTMVFITSHNTPTYETKDIGLAFIKEERWSSDRVIIVTGNEQAGRFKTILAALGEVAPLLAAKTVHVATGFLKLPSGKMSSREGNVITAARFINEVIAQASAKNTDPLIAEQVALGAIKYMILRQAPGSDIIFDAEKSLSLLGDSGPYVQYALVRAKSVLTQANGASVADAPKEPYLLERIILHFPEVVARAARELAPNLLVNYLTELASEWNSFYAQERIIGGDHETHKLLVARAFVNTMTNGLALLGIPTPERM